MNELVNNQSTDRWESFEVLETYTGQIDSFSRLNFKESSEIITSIRPQ